MNSLEKPYIPLELRRLSKYLSIELSVLTTLILIIAFNWLYTYDFKEEIKNSWLIISAFIIFPLIIFKWIKYLITLIEKTYSNLLKCYRIHLIIHFLFLLIVLFLFILNWENFYKLWTIYFLIFAVFSFNLWGIILYRSVIKIKLFWNTKKSIPFFKKLTVSFLINESVKSILKFYVFFIIFFIHITLVLSWSASHLTLETDLVKLLPDDFKSVRSLKEAQTIFGGFGYITVIVESDESNKEKDLFEKENNLKLITEYRKNNNAQIKMNPRINFKGEVVSFDEKSIKHFYYYKQNSKKISNLNLKKQKIIWEAKLSKTKKFINNIAKEIEKLNEILYCNYRYPTWFLKNNAVLFQDIGKLALFYSRAKKIKRNLMFNEIGLKLNLEKNNKNIFSKNFIQNFFTVNSLKKGFFSKDGYYLSGNNKAMVLLIKPSSSSLNVDFNRQLLIKIKSKINKNLLSFKKKDSSFPSIKIAYTGRYVQKVELKDLINKDLKIISFLSLLFIIGVVVLYFKRYEVLIFLTFPMLFSILWTFGITYWYFGYLNILTGFLSVILMGLGIDFGIHFLSRFYEERNKGISINNSIHNMLSKTGKAILTSTVTTIIAFIMLLFSDFKGFSEFGFIGLIGLCMSYIAMFYVLTIILILYDKINRFFKNYFRFYNKQLVKIFYFIFIFVLLINFLLIWNYIKNNIVESFLDLPNYYFILPYLILLKFLIYLRNKYLKQISYFLYIEKIYKKPNFILITTVLICLFSIIFLNKISFEYDFSKVAGQTNSFYINQKLSEQFNTALIPSVVIANDYKEEKEIYEIYQKIKSSKGKGSRIAYVQSLSFYIPKNQEEKLEFVKELRKIIYDFEKEVNSKNLKDNIQIKELKDFLKEFNEKYLLNLDFIYQEMIPEEIVRSHRNLKDLNDKRILIHIFPYPEDQNNGEKIKEFAKEIRNIKLKDKWLSFEDYRLRSGLSEKEIFSQIGIGKIKSKKENGKRIFLLNNREISATGENLILGDILFLVEKDAFFIVSLVFLFCIIIVWLDFKRLKSVLIIILPLLLNVLIFLALMILFKVKLNILNIVILPLILGISLDGGVHLYHRYLDEGKESLFYSIRITGTAISFAFLTTLLGFASLIFAHHYALSSIGSLAVLGIISAFLSSLLILPALILKLKKSL